MQVVSCKTPWILLLLWLSEMKLLYLHSQFIMLLFVSDDGKLNLLASNYFSFGFDSNNLFLPLKCRKGPRVYISRELISNPKYNSF
jgi:hypothetical protein